MENRVLVFKYDIDECRPKLQAKHPPSDYRHQFLKNKIFVPGLEPNHFHGTGQQNQNALSGVLGFE